MNHGKSVSFALVLIVARSLVRTRCRPGGEAGQRRLQGLPAPEPGLRLLHL